MGFLLPLGDTLWHTPPWPHPPGIPRTMEAGGVCDRVAVRVRVRLVDALRVRVALIEGLRVRVGVWERGGERVPLRVAVWVAGGELDGVEVSVAE